MTRCIVCRRLSKDQGFWYFGWAATAPPICPQCSNAAPAPLLTAARQAYITHACRELMKRATR